MVKFDTGVKVMFFGEHVDGLLRKCTLRFKLEIILRFEDFLNDLDLWSMNIYVIKQTLGKNSLKTFEVSLKMVWGLFLCPSVQMQTVGFVFSFFFSFKFISFYCPFIKPLKFIFPSLTFHLVKLVWKRCWSLPNQIPPHDFRGISKVSLFGTQFPSCIIILLQTFRKETKGGGWGQILYWKYWKNNSLEEFHIISNASS